jgi:hypothetical protein
MHLFTKKYEYEGQMDKEVIDLCNAMNALPGIKTTDSCCGHSSSSFMVFFRVTSDKGLFFLTRCVDRRYWKYGYLWKIELSVGDRYIDGILPITYLLTSSPIVGEDAYEQAKSLIGNMNHHLNYVNFLKGYGLNIKDFDI